MKDGIHISGDGYGYIAAGIAPRRYHLTIEYKWGDQAGLDRGAVADAVRAFTGGLSAGRYFDGNDAVDVLIWSGAWDTPEELAGVPIFTPQSGIQVIGELADIVRTVTGVRHTLLPEHFEQMRDGTLVANAGHFQHEIDVKGLAARADETARPRRQVHGYRLGDRGVHLLGDGNIVVEEYYNQNNSGFGAYIKLPASPPDGYPAFGPASMSDAPSGFCFGLRCGWKGRRRTLSVRQPSRCSAACCVRAATPPSSARSAIRPPPT